MLFLISDWIQSHPVGAGMSKSSVSQTKIYHEGILVIILGELKRPGLERFIFAFIKERVKALKFGKINLSGKRTKQNLIEEKTLGVQILPGKGIFPALNCSTTNSSSDLF